MFGAPNLRMWKKITQPLVETQPMVETFRMSAGKVTQPRIILPLTAGKVCWIICLPFATKNAYVQTKNLPKQKKLTEQRSACSVHFQCLDNISVFTKLASVYMSQCLCVVCCRCAFTQKNFLKVFFCSPDPFIGAEAGWGSGDR